jgi:FkbM family methyltransferase
METQNKRIGWDMNAWLCPLLLSIRPSELADVLKKILCIQRQQVTTLQGLTLWVDPASHFGNEVIKNKMYEPQMTHIILQLLRSQDTFVDVGANEGYFGVLAAKKVLEGKVYCIEPQMRLKEIILKNVEKNQIHNLSIHTLALSDHNGTAEFFLRPTMNTGSSSLFNHTRISGKRETVATVTLKHFIEQNGIKNIRLLKIDCEGAEDLVILNGKSIFEQKRVDFIALEYHPHIREKDKLDRVHDFLVSCGYCLISIKDQSIYYLKELLGEIEDLQRTLK